VTLSSRNKHRRCANDNEDDKDGYDDGDNIGDFLNGDISELLPQQKVFARGCHASMLQNSIA
jgi:hypothetical protein